ncbi:MAG: hypothetical protein KAS39_02760, partial [Actinomycetia bacterium]|nr:hypothetical protein [Actinomycetes bacterium]
MVGVILDLARRGYIKVNEMKREKKGIFGTKEKYEYAFQRLKSKGEKDLSNMESSLMYFLFDVIGKENVVT